MTFLTNHGYVGPYLQRIEDPTTNNNLLIVLSSSQIFSGTINVHTSNAASVWNKVGIMNNSQTDFIHSAMSSPSSGMTGCQIVTDLARIQYTVRVASSGSLANTKACASGSIFSKDTGKILTPVQTTTPYSVNLGALGSGTYNISSRTIPANTLVTGKFTVYSNSTISSNSMVCWVSGASFDFLYGISNTGSVTGISMAGRTRGVSCDFWYDNIGNPSPVDIFYGAQNSGTSITPVCVALENYWMAL